MGDEVSHKDLPVKGQQDHRSRHDDERLHWHLGWPWYHHHCAVKFGDNNGTHSFGSHWSSSTQQNVPNDIGRQHWHDYHCSPGITGESKEERCADRFVPFLLQRLRHHALLPSSVHASHPDSWSPNTWYVHLL